MKMEKVHFSAAFPKKNGSTNEKTYETSVWNCTDPSCGSWMREEFAFEPEPICPICRNKMELGTRMLPKLPRAQMPARPQR